MSGPRPPRALRLVVALSLASASAACGVPTGGQASPIAASDVPPGLTSPSPGPAPTSGTEPRAEPTPVYLLAEDDRLVPRPRESTGSDREERLESLLDQLAEGPSAEELGEQLTTALPPGVGLTVVEVSGGTATVDIDVPAEAPSGWASRRAVAQIVLTATGVPGVDAVLLTLAGEPVEAPLPSGELTQAPLTAADYGPFLEAPAPAPPS